MPTLELGNPADAHEHQGLPDLAGEDVQNCYHALATGDGEQELLAALPDWNVHGPLDFGTNFTVRGPSRVLVSVD